MGSGCRWFIPALKHIKGREGLEALGVLSIATRCFFLLFFALLAWTKFLITTFLLPDKTDSPHGTSYLKRLGIGLRDETTL